MNNDHNSDIKYRLYLKRKEDGWIVNYDHCAGCLKFTFDKFDQFKQQLLLNSWMNDNSNLIDAIEVKGSGWLPSDPDNDPGGKTFQKDGLLNECHLDEWGFMPVL